MYSGKMGNMVKACLIAFLCHVFSVRAQCYQTQEAGGILKDTTRTVKKLDVLALRDEVIMRTIELMKDNPKCQTLVNEQVCAVKDLETCLNMGGEFTSDQLELYNSAEESMKNMIFPTDLIQTSDLCYLTTEGKATLNDLKICKQMIDLISTTVSLPNKFVEGRLIIKSKAMMGVKDDISGQTLCKANPYVMAYKKYNLLILHNLERLYYDLEEIRSMVNLDPISSCGNFQFGKFTVEEITCLETELGKSKRRKRSTLLNYMLGDGQRTDKIANKVHDITLALNANAQNSFKNEELLNLQGVTNEQNIMNLAKTTRYSESLMAASLHKMQKAISNQLTHEQFTMQNVVTLAEIDEAKESLQKFTDQLGKMLLHTEDICLSLSGKYGCILIKQSHVQIEDNKIVLDMNMKYLTNAEFGFVSCEPEIDNNQVSIFHGKHGIIRQDGNIQLGDKIISEENLKLNVGEKRTLLDKDFYLRNVFITTDKHRIGLTCKEPELIFATGLPRFNCTQKTSWLKRSGDMELHTVAGSISHEEAMLLHVTQRSRFLQNFEELTEQQGTIISQANQSSIHKLILNKLTSLTPFQTAAISLGSGAACLIFISLLCCCFKCCNPCKTCCRKEDVQSAEAGNGLTVEEVFNRSQSVLESYLDRLKRGVTPGHPAPQ